MQRHDGGVKARHHSHAETPRKLKHHGRLRVQPVRHVGLQGHHLLSVEAHAEVDSRGLARVGGNPQHVSVVVLVDVVAYVRIQEDRA